MEVVNEGLATDVLNMLSFGATENMSAENSKKVIQMIDQIGTKLDLGSMPNGKFEFASSDLEMNVETLSLDIGQKARRSLVGNRTCNGINGTRTRMTVNLDTVYQELDTYERNQIDRTICVAYA